MIINKTYAVFGLGRYGRAVAAEIAKSGAEVMAVDFDEEAVNDAMVDVPICKCADVSDENVLKQLGISNVDVVIIAMADSLEASVMSTMLCKQMGVPEVIVKCGNEMHRRILRKVGADKVVFPESESGVRLAKNLLSSDFIDIIELSKGVSMLELNVKNDWVGKNLIELNLRKRYSINVVAIKKDGDVSCDIDPSAPIEEGTKLIVIADPEKLNRLR